MTALRLRFVFFARPLWHLAVQNRRNSKEPTLDIRHLLYSKRRLAAARMKMESVMRKTFLSWLFAAGLLFSTASIAQAQYATAPRPGATAVSPDNQSAPPATPQRANSNQVTLAGCLGQGAGADEYTLYRQTANSWELKSDSVDLEAHLGQAVSITAVKPPNDKGPLMVISISMVSESCDRP
jgi:hypothetical protein